MSETSKIDALWDDAPIDITADANLIWSVANKLRGAYMPDKYGDVIIPMAIIRRLECTLQPTKEKVVEEYEKDPNCPAEVLCSISTFQFYNTSRYTLKTACDEGNETGKLVSVLCEYIDSFSENVRDILNELEIKKHIEKMSKENCLYEVASTFGEMHLEPSTYDSIKMGYIFENLIGRFFQNVDAGQFYTGRDIIKLCVSLLIAEGCDDIYEDHKIISVCDQACGTGGMLSTAYNYLKHCNPTANIELYGQEYMGQSYAVGLAEMLIKGQNSENFRHADTLKTDCFENVKMRFLLENPPFGTPWGGNNAKDKQEEAVREEYLKAPNGRWGAGLPGTSDSQLLFIQSAVNKMDDECGRAAIISNGSPLFSGGTSSGESQIRRYLLENDLIEAIVQLPTDLFYNTGITTYIWLLSKNKREERKGKIQLIDVSTICHALRKGLGMKRNEFTPEDREKITNIYKAFKESEYCKIYNNTDFIYREYTIMQPLQRSYAITSERIDEMVQRNVLSSLYDPAKVLALEALGETIKGKDKNALDKFYKNKETYDAIMDALNKSTSADIYKNPESFMPVLTDIFKGIKIDKKTIEKIADGLSVMDKSADIQKDKKGNILYDTYTKDTEIVPWSIDIDDYMKKEVLPHIPDAVAFFEEDLGKKKPVVKTGAEIPFTKCFYKYKAPTPSKELEKKFSELEELIGAKAKKLFGGD